MDDSWGDHRDSVEASRRYHELYSDAVNNPARREILSLLASRGPMPEEEVVHELELDEASVHYHVEVLERGFCVEREGGALVITREGSVVEKIEGGT